MLDLDRLLERNHLELIFNDDFRTILLNIYRFSIRILLLVLVKLRCDQDGARHRISMVKLEVVYDIDRPRFV